MNTRAVSRELATIALGSNLGDRKEHLAAGLRGLASTKGISLSALSRVYETEPVGPAGQGPYLNAVVRVATDLSPRALLERLLEIELHAGRERGQRRWGPRTLDLDLLLFGDRVIEEDGLSVPHPRLAERFFVLAPLCDIAADERHPVLGRTFAEFARERGVRGGACVWSGGALDAIHKFGSQL